MKLRQRTLHPPSDTDSRIFVVGFAKRMGLYALSESGYASDRPQSLLP